ncbi:MAG: DUF1153 domain-containing protein [Acetobacteraceae bacterium]|nr:DUF1153 domain-containing protein [Acetobacteraceae bacterium]MBV8521380.1 DUF1153 domain-containing protein [Acetobacteraceae bacterium]
MVRPQWLKPHPRPSYRRRPIRGGWVARRKAAVVAAVLSGTNHSREACWRYQMSEEEFIAWQHAFEVYGLKACTRACLGDINNGTRWMRRAMHDAAGEQLA